MKRRRETGFAVPHLVGIAGPTGSGKTALARLLARRLGDRCRLIGIDAYYRDLSVLPIEERVRTNFDLPEALDEELLLAQLRALSEGLSIEKPVYDFAVHARTARTERVDPARFVIVEGLFVFCWPELRALCGTRVFLEADAALCLGRREARDVAERGRTRESVRRQFEETVWPMYERFVWPTREYAEIVLDANAPLDTLCRAVLAHLKNKGIMWKRPAAP